MPIIKLASTRVNQKKFDEAIVVLDETIERITLKVALGPFYDIPSLIVMETIIFVIRNYRDILKQRNTHAILETEKKLGHDLLPILSGFLY